MLFARLWKWLARWTRRQPTSLHHPLIRPRRCCLMMETLEAREVPALNPTGLEQEMLELVNTMRTDPRGELNRLLVSTSPLLARDPQVQAALDYYGVNGSALASQWTNLAPVQPLAWNEALVTSALGHNQRMIAADRQAHQLPGEASIGSRITTAGYTGWSTVGENIYAYATSVGYGHAGFAIDWGVGPNGLQSPAGHRLNLMNAHFREVGISIAQESSPNTQVGPYVITQDFGNRASLGNPFVLGVVYRDANRNNRYDAGEGLGQVNVALRGSAGTFTTTSMTAGGYQLKVPAGSYTVTFTGGTLTSSITKSVTVGSANVKVDGVAGQPSGGGGGGGGGGSTTNHAPVVNPSTLFSLSTIAEDAKASATKTVASLLGAGVTDVDANALRGLAITRIDTTQGAWQYSTNGTSWTNITGVTENAALLLRSTDSLRFVPRPNFSGEAAFSFRAWDQTTGTRGTKANLTTGVGGATAYSAATALARILITPVNDAPVLRTTSGFSLNPVTNNGSANPGTFVSRLLGSTVSDTDSGALQGVAITALNSTQSGTWQFSTNGGRSWTNFGTVGTATARLLRAQDLIRFVPNAGYRGQVSLSFRAWDQTSGVAGGTVNLTSSRFALRVGGSTAFSAALAAALLRVQ
jgi:hypothetical protein